MNEDFVKTLFLSQKECTQCPSPESIRDFFTVLLGTMFPDYAKQEFDTLEEFKNHFEGLRLQLVQILKKNSLNDRDRADQLATTFFEELPKVYSKLQEDIEGLYSGDPAAKSRSEIIRSYPGFYAIASYRIAHQLSKQSIPIIPRIITEQAHSKTGIDIHPGASIGRFFCIDHGTGVVIGETTIIGDNVKIYQGVTLGALSVNKSDASKKRHPTIGNNVVIYSGATILGGQTTIGDDSIIGGNVWITESVPPGSKIYYRVNDVDGVQTEHIS